MGYCSNAVSLVLYFKFRKKILEDSMQSKKVTKYDLVDGIRQETGYEKRIIQDIFESALEQLKESLMDGATIELRGFGTFELRLRKERKKARNPKTGDSLSVPPHYIVAFRSGQELKKAVWNLTVEE